MRAGAQDRYEAGPWTATRTKLTEIYGWFTEGFDTADLKDAKVRSTS
jgi:hypothetical protein